MKPRFIFIGVLLVVALGFGWHNHRQLAHLRDARLKLVAQAAAKGISLDPETPSQVSLPSKLPRVDRVAEAKQVSAGFIAYAKEMRGLGEKWDLFALDETTRRRIIAQMDRVSFLDAGQLKILIGELHANPDGSDQRRYLIGFALHRLMKNHPREMLAILMETPGLFEGVQGRGSWAQSLVEKALCRLAEYDLAAARRWLDQHRDVLSAAAVDDVMQRLIGGAAAQDLRLALEMTDESGMVSPHFLSHVIAQAGPQQRDRALPLLREWTAARPDAATPDLISEDALKILAFSDYDSAGSGRGSFEKSSAWIDQAGLSPEELELVTGNLQNHIEIKESGHWIEWLGRSLPDEIAQRRVRSTFDYWVEADYRAAGTWLEAAAEGPMKDSMVDAYVKKVSPMGKEAAIRLVLALPEGGKRDGALKELYQRWPRKDEVSKAAAEAFAEEHGIKK
jgi:hypothetical protein